MAPAWLVNLVQLGVVACAIGYLFRFPIRPALAWAIAGVAIGVAAWESLGQPEFLMDATVFRNAGSAIWAHRDPYASFRVLNPPTALPLFALLVLVPASIFAPIWKATIIMGQGATPVLTKRLLETQRRDEDRTWLRVGLPVAIAVVVMSVAARISLAVGQLTFVTTLAAIGALVFHAHKRPILAGIALAIASIKITTMLPFLLLFLHRRDWKTWAALILTGLVLTFATIAPHDLPARLTSALANIRGGAVAGGMNDYSFANRYSVDLVSFDHAVYHLGLRNRSLLSLFQLGGAGLLGWWVFRRVNRMGDAFFVQKAALVACYSMLFLYHREYDSVILTLPLMYSLEQSGSCTGRAMWFYRLAALAMLGVLYLRIKFLLGVVVFVQNGGFLARVTEMVVLPAATWLTLAALFLLAGAMRLSVDVFAVDGESSSRAG